MTTSRRFSAGTQMALAILIMLGVFAGGMAIAQARTSPDPVTPPVELPALTVTDEAEATPAARPVATTPASRADTAAEATVPFVAAVASTVAREPESDSAVPDTPDEMEPPIVDECVWTPSDEELRENHEETAALAGVLDRYGIAHTEEGDELGFVWLEWDWEDPVVEAVVSSFYAGRYPLDEAIAENEALNEALAAALTAAGIDFELIVEEEWAWIEYDWADETANAIADGVYEEFYGPFDELAEACYLDDGHFEDDDEPTEEELAEQTRVNNALIAALDAGGHEWTLVEEGPWAWVEFDYDDPDAVAATDAVYEELFGPFEEIGCEIHDEAWDDEEWQAHVAERIERLGRLASALETAGVAIEFEADEYGAWLTFDIDDEAAVPIVTAELADPAVG